MDERLANLEREVERLNNIIQTTGMINQMKLEMYRDIIELNTDIKLTRTTGVDPKKSPVIVPKKSSTPVVAPKKSPVVVPITGSSPSPPPLALPPPIIPTFDSAKETDLILKISTNKNFSRNLMELQKLRTRVFTTTPLDTYKGICSSHVSQLTKIFKDKGFTDKKIETTVSRGLTSLEMRLIRYTNYFNTNLEPDDLKNLNANLIADISRPGSHKNVYDPSVISTSMMNYSIALLPLHANIQRVLFNEAHPATVIYNTPSKKTSDPYSFYTLTTDEDGVRSWTMDCRLEEMTLHLKNDLLPYCVSIFREMYCDVFGDNIYREDYKKRCILTECDCEQLLGNMMILASNVSLNDMLRNLIKTNSTLADPDTKTDKFNITSDDNLQKRRWKEFNATNDDILPQLFDSITPAQVASFK
jgi:hypothetical protein